MLPHRDTGGESRNPGTPTFASTYTLASTIEMTDKIKDAEIRKRRPRQGSHRPMGHVPDGALRQTEILIDTSRLFVSNRGDSHPHWHPNRFSAEPRNLGRMPNSTVFSGWKPRENGR